MSNNKQYHCNECYHKPNGSEGCYTYNVDKFIANKLPSCLDGTWKNQSVFPLFYKIKETYVK